MTDQNATNVTPVQAFEPDQPISDSRPIVTEAPAAPLKELLRVLDLQEAPAGTARPSDDTVFIGESLHQPTGRVYGGQVLSQALWAAGQSVPADRLPHSLHGYFLRAGDVRKPIVFGVENLRDGGSFSARRTHAYQDGVPILSMIASFQLRQDGVEHHDRMPDVPGPDDVASAIDVLGPIDDPIAQYWSNKAAFDLRHVGGSIYLGPGSEHSPRQAVWIRSRGHVVGSQLLHRALLAYACDQIMLEPALRRSGASWSTPGFQIASLDHAMWWHRDARADEWLLYVQSSPSAQGGRALGSARVFAADGTLVASIAQEAMFRLPLDGHQ